jgi:Tol biopolymer transport system component
MLKRIIIAAAVATLALSSLAWGDAFRVMGEPVQLTSEETYFMQPVWSPLGDELLVAGENYQGLWRIKREGGEPQRISDLAGAGFLPVWDPAGTRIACRVSRTENKRKLSAIAVYDLSAGTSTELTEYRKDLGLPQWIDGGRKLIYSTGSAVEAVEAPGASKTVDADEMPSVHLRDGAIVLRAWPGEEETSLQPVEQSVLWAVLSPDGRHIAFEALGAELYVIGADGAGLVSLGRGERPRWSPNGNWITYMITEDDGYQMLSADIYAVHRDGSGRTAVTQTPDRLEMNPHWSPDGRMIACDTRGEGVILLIPVETERSYPPER